MGIHGSGRRSGVFPRRGDSASVYAKLLACLALLLFGCATPVGVTRVDPLAVHRALTSNVLTERKLSTPSRIILQRADLYDEFRASPELSRSA